MHMPEEINRILTDRVSDILFTPNHTALKNLHNEGFDKMNCKIINSGDVMKDSAIFYKPHSIKPNINLKTDFIVFTLHRAENTNDKEKITRILNTLNEIAKEIQVIFPIHPRTKNRIKELNIKTDNLNVIEPVGYLSMVWLLDNCRFIMSDSGGLQKEAYFFGKPCIILRDETEWVELVDLKFNDLVGSDIEKIFKSYNKNIKSKNKLQTSDLYGNGKASEIIVKELISF